MKKLTLLVAIICLLSFSNAQNTINLTFSAVDSADYTQLDSIKVMNMTQGGDTVLYYPDTVLSLVTTGINEILMPESGFRLFTNYPNPVTEQTNITLQVPEAGNVKLTITDILGRILLTMDRELNMGTHLFNFIPGTDKIYLLTARYNNESRSITMLCSPIRLNKKVSLEYTGSIDEHKSLKYTASIQNFLFDYGDELLYIGYYDTLQSGMLDSPEESDTYIFQFAYNIPCPGTPTVEYEGQTYNTVQIMSQCWMKENLNVGVMIEAPASPSDNDTIEKYCMGNMGWSCDEVGGLYFWNEMMNYTNQTGGQGICPDGWHVPTDMEWKILEGVTDSEYGIGDTKWNALDWRGYNAGGQLKQTGTEYWESPNTGATDIYGFTALPGGYFIQGDFWGPGYKGLFWSSKYPNKYFRNMDWNQMMIKRQAGGGYDLAISVRCIKD